MSDMRSVSVLVVDDDRSEVESLRHCLSQMAGFRISVTHVTTNAEAVEALRAQAFGLVFLDYQLGPKAGLALLNDLRSVAPFVPSIVLSGAGNERTAVEAMKAGAVDYIVKAQLSVHSLERAVIHAVETQEKEQIIRRQQEVLQSLARTDDLTGIWNRRYFMERMTWQMRMAKRYEMPQTFCMCDIDHFKQVNDTYGHFVGDDVLRVTARTLSAGLRDIDLLGRYGGEEFCILLVNTGIEQARPIAERLRERLGELVFDAEGGRTFQATASFGIAESSPEEDAESLIQRADEAMYSAKQAGRNCVRVHADSDE